MNKNTCKSIFILLFILAVSSGWSQQQDWMLTGDAFKASIRQDGKDLILSNGLVNRIFRNGTTIGLNNLVTGEGLLRSIRPEAELTINNCVIPVGGFTGQPIHNYFLAEWLNEMTDIPLSFHYTGFEESAIKKRFEWKPRKEWMASSAEWPPKGKMLTLKFKADAEMIQALTAKYASSDDRKIMLEEPFQKLSDQWEVQISKSNKPNSFVNEGKAGEILVNANTASFATHNLNPETEVIIARINPGTDKSATWGPGIAWVFDKKTVKLYLRTAENKFGITGAGLEYEATYPGMKEGESVYLQLQRTGEKLYCNYSYDGERWTELLEMKLPADAQSKQLRVGKMDGKGENSEINEQGEAGRCRIEMVKAYGKPIVQEKAQQKFEHLKNVEIHVNYEIYDGIPLISKWVSFVNQSGHPIQLNTYKSEILAVTEPENVAVFDKSFMTPNITIETDFTHCQKHEYVDMDFNRMFQRHSHWSQDKVYSTQIDWLLKNPCLLESYPEYGPEIEIANGELVETHRTWELFHDTWERERKTLQIRKMYRVTAPWVEENPIFMHVRHADNESVKKAIDQCAEVGFEMVIMTFGSGVSMEDASPANLERMKLLADYGHAKGIALGGYSLLASRSIDKENDVVMPPGKEPMFGNSPCVESQWGQQYIKNLEKYLKNTGQDILEHDGSYPGDECASTSHPGHKGLNDSQWKQFQTMKQFYHWCKSQGIFLNIPDWYFMNGQNKTGMGYRETNWSLPREQQEVIERQNIYDGTWNKTPSMGWMMVPLVEYHGGGKAATIEPLKEHLPHYETRLANNFGAGVIACYRGPQLFDSPETKAIVKKWVDFYKAHRAILNSDIIHIRRPDGTDWDGILHVNPELQEKGLLMVYNPLNKPIKRTIEIPVYYTGLNEKTTVTDQKNKQTTYTISRDYKVTMEIEIPAKGRSWYIFE